MKKNKTTKPTGRSYKSVPELLEGEKSNIKLSPFNCKQAGLKREINCSSYKVNLLQTNTIKTLHERIDEQIPNQFIWCEEEKEVYFYNKDKHLFKLKFEPIMTKKNKQKNQTTEEYMEDLKNACLKKEIENLAIPWSKFHNKGETLFTSFYNLNLLTVMFIDLLDLVREKKIKITCGVAMMHLLTYYANYDPSLKKIIIGGCEITPELDFNACKYDLVYDNVVLVGQAIPEPIKEDNRAFEAAAKKIVPGYKKSLWEKFKNWFDKFLTNRGF
jgi:hypothetical protein